MEGRPREERELVLRAQGGDARAFEELVRPHEEVAFRVAYLITRNAAEAEDAAQEGLVKAWRALGRFRAGEPMRPWLLRSSRTRRATAAARAGAATGWRSRAAAEVSGEAAPSPRMPRSTRTSGAASSTRSRSCRSRPRLALACRYLLELSEDETAAALGVRRGTVKSRSARALERLREAYGPRA